MSKKHKALPKEEWARGRHIFSTVPIPGTFDGPAADPVVRCRKCGFSVIGHLATAEWSLKEKNLPLTCEDYLVYEVIES